MFVDNNAYFSLFICSNNQSNMKNPKENKKFLSQKLSINCQLYEIQKKTFNFKIVCL